MNIKQLMEHYRSRIEDHIRKIADMDICEKNVDSMYRMLMCYDKITDMMRDEDF